VSTRTQDAIAKAIREAYPLPERIALLRRLATWDLWHGPSLPSELDDDDAKAWPGFVSACQELRAWADDTLPRTLYYDADAGCLSDTEPEPWTDEEGETFEPSDFYRVEWREILAAVFPSKLCEYL
jgi:hypothetical protein